MDLKLADLIQYRFSFIISCCDYIFILLIKVRFTQKILVKWSKCHSCEPNIAPGLLFPVNGMNGSDKMLIFSFFFISRNNLLKAGSNMY